MGRVCIALAALALLVAPAGVEASHAKNCGVIYDVKKGRDFRVRASGVGCDFARTWSRRYIRRGRRPDGWSCGEPAGEITFYCQRGESFYYAQRA